MQQCLHDNRNGLEKTWCPSDQGRTKCTRPQGTKTICYVRLRPFHQAAAAGTIGFRTDAGENCKRWTRSHVVGRFFSASFCDSTSLLLCVHGPSGDPAFEPRRDGTADFVHDPPTHNKFIPLVSIFAVLQYANVHKCDHQIKGRHEREEYCSALFDIVHQIRLFPFRPHIASYIFWSRAQVVAVLKSRVVRAK